MFKGQRESKKHNSQAAQSISIISDSKIRRIKDVDVRLDYFVSYIISFLFSQFLSLLFLFSFFSSFASTLWIMIFTFSSFNSLALAATNPMKEATKDVEEARAPSREDDSKTSTSSTRASFPQLSSLFSPLLWPSLSSLSLRLLSSSLLLSSEDDEEKSDEEEREIKLSDERLV